MIAEAEVVRLLEDGGLPLGDWHSDTELVLDSLTFTWLVHLLEERHGIVVAEEDEEELAASESVGALHRNLLRLLPAGSGREEAHRAR
ncbi:acyl carrier protein [Kitasatospora sp. NPDC052896]|uniref:acyl carrier protein n=1 Tax=Kitasatospora sp. NPDC052896 TaxID=3364061 RepID=UPI0037C4F1F3